VSKMPKLKRDTPLEATTKGLIRKSLDDHDWFWWNVPMNEYAKAGISDIHAVRDGMFMVIEGKRVAKDEPTELQKGFLRSIMQAGHFAFVVDRDNLSVFKLFLTCLDRSILAQSRKEKVAPEDGAGLLDCIAELTRRN
jgi:hypothetical protein